MNNSRLIALVLVPLLLCGAAHAGPKEDLAQYGVAVQAGLDAYRKGDNAAAETAFAEALRLEPQRARVLYYLAAVAARRGEPSKAFAYLNRLADTGMTADLDAEEDFASLRALPDYLAVKTRFGYNAAPLCPCTTVYEGTTEPFIAEGIAYDAPRRRLLVGSVHTGRIVAIAGGKLTEYAKWPDNYAPFGMAIDQKRGTLWVAAATLPQTAGSIPAQHYRAALFALDLKTAVVRGTYAAPAGAKHAFGDLGLAGDGTVYVTDSVEGSLYRLSPGAKALEVVGTAGMFSSPQGIVIKPDGSAAVIADYAMGLFTIDLQSGELTPAVTGKDASETTLGIDGLALIQGGKFPHFVATQNGITTPRVISFVMYQFWKGLDGATVPLARGAPVADVSLATSDGKGGFYAVAVSQWSAFDEDKTDPVRPVPRWKIVHYPN